MYRNRALLRRIDQSVLEIFKYHFVLLSHAGTQIEVGLTQGAVPTFDERADNRQADAKNFEEADT